MWLHCRCTIKSNLFEVTGTHWLSFKPEWVLANLTVMMINYWVKQQLSKKQINPQWTKCICRQNRQYSNHNINKAQDIPLKTTHSFLISLNKILTNHRTDLENASHNKCIQKQKPVICTIMIHINRWRQKAYGDTGYWHDKKTVLTTGSAFPISLGGYTVYIDNTTHRWLMKCVQLWASQFKEKKILIQDISHQNHNTIKWCRVLQVRVQISQNVHNTWGVSDHASFSSK